jgi:putative phosphoesterase
MEIGVISDTHGVLEPEVEAAFRGAGVTRIIHAGDIGGPEVIRRLSAIAEVVAVAGNSDSGPFASRFPARTAISVEGYKLLVIHDLGCEDRPSQEVGSWIRLERPRVVVFGHLHRPVLEEREGILYFNPGSAAFARGGGRRSIGFLTCRPGAPLARVVDLTPGY